MEEAKAKPDAWPKHNGNALWESAVLEARKTADLTLEADELIRQAAAAIRRAEGVMQGTKLDLDILRRNQEARQRRHLSKEGANSEQLAPKADPKS